MRNPLASRCASKQKVGHVHAGDQQNEADYSKHDQKRAAKIRPDYVFVYGDGSAGYARASVGILLLDAARDCFNNSRSLFDAHAGVEPRRRLPDLIIAAHGRLRRRRAEPDREPNLYRIRPLRIFRHDADHGRRPPVYVD
jgi:hypothetical protein